MLTKNHWTSQDPRTLQSDLVFTKGPRFRLKKLHHSYKGNIGKDWQASFMDEYCCTSTEIRHRQTQLSAGVLSPCTTYISLA